MTIGGSAGPTDSYETIGLYGKAKEEGRLVRRRETKPAEEKTVTIGRQQFPIPLPARQKITYGTVAGPSDNDPNCGAFFLIQRHVTVTKQQAAAELILSPIWVPLRAIASLFTSVLNIFSLGSITAERSSFAGFCTKEGQRQRWKAIGQSALSILATPIAMGAEIACSISHIINPEDERMDKIATRLWTGGRVRFNQEQKPKT